MTAPARNNSAAAIQAALEHHRAGRLAQAEEIYKQILQTDPGHPDALHYLGAIASAQGKYEEAAGLIKRAIQSKPSRTMYYNLGNALFAIGKLDAAAESYSQALTLNQNYFEAHFNLGNTLHAQGKLDKAVQCYHQALAIKPNAVEVLCNLGNTLQIQSKIELAIETYRKAILLKPDCIEAYLGLGNAFIMQDNMKAALECFRNTLSLKHNHVEALVNAGIALTKLSSFDSAKEYFGKALAFMPDNADALNWMGHVFQGQCQISAAIESFQKALALRSDYAVPFSNLLYLHAFTRDISPEEERKLAIGWEKTILSDNERAAARSRALSCSSSFARTPRAGRKLKIGVVSAELHQHSVAEFLEPFLEQLDRDRFHLTLYPTIIHQGTRTARFKELADEYQPVAEMSDEAAAELIRADQIDILIDTTGHMNGCRLGIFAHRAAPVQCHYIGYHGTTGLTEMDWYIADNTLLPPAYDAHFCERIWRLPRVRLAYRSNTSLPESRWAPSPDGAIWLGSFNNLAKVREQTLDLWAKVMNALPESKILLKDKKAVDRSTQERIKTELARHGIGEERIEFIASVADWNAHMALYDRLDIALDTLPLNSETTAFDALWMGVPLVTLEGNWVGGRQASTILHTLGKPEWVAHSEDEYVKIVTQLAGDVERRKQLRASQRALMAASPLCDAKGLARALENAFEVMFDQWLKNVPVQKIHRVEHK